MSPDHQPQAIDFAPPDTPPMVSPREAATWKWRLCTSSGDRGSGLASLDAGGGVGYLPTRPSFQKIKLLHRQGTPFIRRIQGPASLITRLRVESLGASDPAVHAVGESAASDAWPTSQHRVDASAGAPSMLLASMH